jgi:hypothetical protein
MVWREIAADHRYYASLALCDQARDDFLQWAEFLERQADYMDRIPVNYFAITREVVHSS